MVLLSILLTLGPAERIVSNVGVEFRLECRALDMPESYRDQFHARAVALVREGQTITKVAADLSFTNSCLYGSMRRDQVDRGEIEGSSHAEFHELRTAKCRVREPENGVKILHGANALGDSWAQHPRGSSR